MNIMKWSSADGERLMVNLHASLDSIGKSRISQISTRCQFMGVHSTTFDPELRNEFKKISTRCQILGGVHSTTFEPALRNERFNGKLACII